MAEWWVRGEWVRGECEKGVEESVKERTLTRRCGEGVVVVVKMCWWEVVLVTTPAN